MKLQPTTPQEVREKRETDPKAKVANISTAMGDYGKLLDESLQIFTFLQEDLNVQKLQEDIQQKQRQLEEIWETVNTLGISQNLAKFNEGNALQKRIEELRKEEQVLKKRNQPWQDEALQLYHVVNEKLQVLRQR